MAGSNSIGSALQMEMENLFGRRRKSAVWGGLGGRYGQTNRFWGILAGALAIACGAGGGTRVEAQTVIAYSAMRDPYLLVLRELAVHDELHLSDSQRQSLQELNDRLDATFLALRNWPVEKRQEKIGELTAESKRYVATLLDAQQQRRLGQMSLQIRGIQSLLDTRVAERLGVSSGQVKRIEDLIQQAGEKLKELHTRASAGEAHEGLEEEAGRVRQQEQKKIVAVLSAEQQDKLRTLIGPPFALSKLGRTRFKAPEVVGDANHWIQSRPVRIADLRGKVTALHFWTYG